jgi:choline kinase
MGFQITTILKLYWIELDRQSDIKRVEKYVYKKVLQNCIQENGPTGMAVP